MKNQLTKSGKAVIRKLLLTFLTLLSPLALGDKQHICGVSPDQQDAFSIAKEISDNDCKRNDILLVSYPYSPDKNKYIKGIMMHTVAKFCDYDKQILMEETGWSCTLKVTSPREESFMRKFEDQKER